MISRRTRAILDLLVGLFALGVALAGRREANRDRTAASGPDERMEGTGCSTEDGCSRDPSEAFRRGLAERTPAGAVSWPWFLVGLVAAVGYCSLYDRDAWSLRRSRSRRAIAGILSMLCGQTLVRSGNETAAQGFGLGTSLGTVLYRTKYGFLEPLPD